MACIVLMASSSNAIVTRPKDPTPQLDSEVGRELVRHGLTKLSMAKTLCTLSKRGMLKDFEGDVSLNSMKRQLTAASRDHAYTHTPYGPLVQSLDLGIDAQLSKWEYLNPFAWLYHLSAMSASFADIMRNICVDGRPLRIVIYADGLVPGNPFRPEKSRNLMCIYWCIADWPQWLLQRSFAWPVFGILRETIIDKIKRRLGPHHAYDT